MATTRTRVTIAFAVALLVLEVVVGFLVTTFYSVPSGRVGWLWAGLVWVVVLVPPILVLRPRRRWRWLASAVVLAAVIGVWSWYSAPPTHDRLAGDFEDRVDLPAPFVEHERDETGNTWCLGRCPELQVHYGTPQAWSSEEREEHLAKALAADGWEIEGTGANPTWRQGRWYLVLTGGPDEGAASITLRFGRWSASTG